MNPISKFTEYVNEKKNRIIILALEAVIVLAVALLMLAKWKSETIIPSDMSLWQSNYITYGDGWYIDDVLYERTEENNDVDMLYGPYLTLPKGDYSVTVNYETNQTRKLWIHSFENDNYIKVDSDELTYNSNSQSLMGLPTAKTFHFSLKKDVENFEVRVSYDGYGYTDIDNIVIATSAYRYRRALAGTIILFIIIDMLIFALPIADKKWPRLKEIIVKYIPLATVILAILINAVYILTRGIYYLDSDMSAELLIAKEMLEEKSIMPIEFYYSTMVQIGGFSAPTFFAIGMLFTKNWIVARAIGTSLMLLATALSVIAVSVQVGIKKQHAYYIAAILMLPFSFAYMNVITFGVYYCSDVMLICLSIATLLYALNNSNDRNKRIICACINLLLAFYYGMTGVKSLMYYYAPLILALTVMLLMAVRDKANNKKESIKSEIMCAVLGYCSVAFAFVGYFVNDHVFSKYFTYVDAGSNQYWEKIDFNKLFDVYGWFLGLFGSQYSSLGHEFTPDRPLVNVVSLVGIIHLMGLFVAALVIVSICRVISRVWDLTTQQRIIVAYVVSSLLVTGIIFAWTTGFFPNQGYWVYLVPVTFILMGIELETEDLKLKYTRGIIIAIAAICLIGTSYASVKDYEETPFRAEPGMIRVTDFIVSNGFENGYAYFWESALMTELSDGRLELWTMGDREIYPWLQKTSHIVPPTGRVFVLNKDGSTCEDSVYLEGLTGNVIYTDANGYEVLEYYVEQ